MLIKFFTSDIAFNDNASYRRVILVNTILVLTIIVFLFFAYINYMLLSNNLLAVFEILSAFISFLALIYLRKKKIIKYAAIVATINLFTFFIIFIYFNQNEHFGIIWSIFLPIFAILVNGRHTGSYFSLAFYMIVIPMAFSGIGVWQDGYWNYVDFIRFTIASLVLTFIMYMNEFSLEKSDDKLFEIRVLENEYIEELKKVAITDSLTGLYNRRHFTAVVPRLLMQAQRQDEFISFFMIDIDYFKEYNDFYGHNKGDDVLQKVAFFLKKHLKRYNDYVFRIGGEEFAGIVCSRKAKETNEWIAQLCEIIEELKIPHDKSAISEYLTVSIGIKTAQVKNGDNMEMFYRESDKALYEAKESGRNRVKFAS